MAEVHVLGKMAKEGTLSEIQPIVNAATDKRAWRDAIADGKFIEIKNYINTSLSRAKQKLMTQMGTHFYRLRHNRGITSISNADPLHYHIRLGPDMTEEQVTDAVKASARVGIKEAYPEATTQQIADYLDNKLDVFFIDDL